MKYFFSWGLLFILPFTIIAYLKAKKNVRIKMLVSSIGFDYIYLNYWKPHYLFGNIHIEDFLYGFLFAGILPSVHNLINKTKLEGKYKFNFKLSILYLIIFFSFFILCTEVLNFNYIYALSLVPFIIGIISYFYVKGNIKDVLLTVLTSIVITITYYNLIILIYPNVIDNHFLMENLIGIKILNIPFEELLFAIGIGVGCTYTYEAIFGLKSSSIYN